MQFKLFSIPATGDLETEEELNRFLRSHRAVSVQKELVNNGDTPCWCFCVEYRKHRGVLSEGGSNRVNRGGNWGNDARNCRSANRNRNTPGNRNNNLGLRVSRARREVEHVRRTGQDPVPKAMNFAAGQNRRPGGSGRLLGEKARRPRRALFD